MSRKLKVDMTGVESYTRCPEGEWLAKLKKIEEVEIQGSGDDGLKAQFEVIKGKAKGSSVFETFSLTEKALWKLKSFLDAIGVKSSGRIAIDLDKLEGKVCIIDVIHDDYNGTKRAKISAYIKPGDSDEDEDDEDIEDEEEEEEETKKPVKKTAAKKTAEKKPSKKRPEPDDEEDEDEDDEDDEEPEPPKKSKKAPAKSSKSSKKPASKKKAEPEDEDEEDEDDWEEDED